MTKTEFVQRAAISMASKVIGTDGTTNNRDWNHVVLEAEALADELEEQCYGFDDESINGHLSDIVACLEAIEDDLCGEDECGSGVLNSIGVSLEKLEKMEVLDDIKTEIHKVNQVIANIGYNRGELGLKEEGTTEKKPNE